MCPSDMVAQHIKDEDLWQRTNQIHITVNQFLIACKNVCEIRENLVVVSIFRHEPVLKWLCFIIFQQIYILIAKTDLTSPREPVYHR